MLVALNGITTMPYPYLTDVQIAKETGYDGLLVVADKLRQYLAVGFSEKQAAEALAGLPALGLGNVADIERCSETGQRELLSETERTCRLAAAIGCGMVQLLTGPLDLRGAYQDPFTYASDELRTAASQNLAAIGEIGRRYGISFYLEPLAWTPLGTLAAALEIIQRADQDNIGLAVDFWHMWNTGTTPADISKLDGGLIRCVDVADSVGPAGSDVSDDQRGRRVWLGAGAIPLKEWVDAVRATGFDGVWSLELLSPQHWQLDPTQAARHLRKFFDYLLV
jgi:sugar phosphate isomerase/epimerase